MVVLLVASIAAFVILIFRNMASPESAHKRRKTRATVDYGEGVINVLRYFAKDPAAASIEPTVSAFSGSQFTPINRPAKRPLDIEDHDNGDIELKDSSRSTKSSTSLSTTGSTSLNDDGASVQSKRRPVTHDMVLTVATSLVEHVEAARHISKLEGKVKKQAERAQAKADRMRKQEEKGAAEEEKRQQITLMKAEAVRNGNKKEIARWTKLEEKEIEKLRKRVEREAEKEKKAAERQRDLEVKKLKNKGSARTESPT